MKFGKSFDRALEEESFPKEWVSASIQYKQLKVSTSFVMIQLMILFRNALTRFDHLRILVLY